MVYRYKNNTAFGIAITALQWSGNPCKYIWKGNGVEMERIWKIFMDWIEY